MGRLKEEDYTALFTDDPINWLKFAAAFVVLITSFVLLFRLEKRLLYLLGWERKREIARSRGHSIPATLVSQGITGGEAPAYDYYGKYQYTLDGEQKYFRAHFYRTHPPRKVTLYYINHPKRLFCCEEHHWDGHLALIHLVCCILPFLLGGFTLLLLGVIE